jgi:hypothetical protein
MRRSEGPLTYDTASASTTVDRLHVVGPRDETFDASAGTLKRTEVDGTTHERIFGPECGQAALEGEAERRCSPRGPWLTARL